MRYLLLAAGLAAWALPAASADRDWYFYQRSERPRDGDLAVQLTGAAGSSDAGSLSRRGFEGEARLDWSPLAQWVMEGGASLGPGATAFRVEARHDFTDDDAHDAVYQAGAGYRRDFGGVSVPYLRLGANAPWAYWHLAAGLLVEKPLAAGRDATDVVLSLGASRPVGEALRAGLEMAGEDLEGLWTADEAEGGARLVVGPTFSLPWRSTAVRFNAGWAHTLTSGAPRDAASGPRAQDGVVAHLSLLF